MLDTLMKFGAYRVNYFEPLIQDNPEAFGFYIRAEIEEGQAYSHDAKHQLYAGLDLIQRILGMNNLGWDLYGYKLPDEPAKAGISTIEKGYCR